MLRSNAAQRAAAAQLAGARLGSLRARAHELREAGDAVVARHRHTDTRMGEPHALPRRWRVAIAGATLLAWTAEQSQSS